MKEDIEQLVKTRNGTPLTSEMKNEREIEFEKPHPQNVLLSNSSSGAASDLP